ncbi:hypothetical protein A1O1_00124 [Capronia coronata CBS 617.96]|uniref:Myb-like domain-containing protein n=1 Tax=Capronia coronata CBS 617.96 TaxID=1182541 RepID=W9Z0B6_9EURO|nr:uncharacterized protein A1O1_00124 [Capronia coronata CBS 617.96]EXJ95006.1 hypothetical protein A1O1_00124 [Capronia coronata CBS 617.96]
MDVQDNQDETDDLLSHIPNAMLLDDGGHPRSDPGASDNSKISLPAEMSNSVPFHQRKWTRLRRHYNDQYLELFRMYPGDGGEEAFDDELIPTQLGAVVWQPSEKAALYQALCQKGRHDLQGLSAAIGTKSEVEVKAYLDNLLEQETDRQLFEPETKNVSHADIPAAIEIGPECETLLDQAADALAAFQEQYDHAVGLRNTALWLIDQTTASELDQKADEAEAAGDLSDRDSGNEDDPGVDDATGLFHLSTFLSLSKQYFMNQGSDGPDQWDTLAEEGQGPTMTMDVVTSFYDLVVNFTRRLVQSCLFMAQCRIRSSTANGHKPSKVVRSGDVTAALSVLGVKKNADTFWIGMARRNNLAVVPNSTKRRSRRQHLMSYEEVEARLSNPRRRRSISTTASEASNKGSRASSVDSFDGSELDTNFEGSSGVESDVAADAIDEVASPGREGDDEVFGSSDEPGTSSSSEGDAEPNVPLSRQDRIQLLEEEQDDYMERMDQEARKLEETRLLQLLGARSEEMVKSEESPGLGARPRVMRKTAQECAGWSVQYQAEWESFGEVLPSESFAGDGPRAKRRRLDVDSIEYAQEL